MGRNILTECEGWTPIIDIMADELGLMTAACYGVVWRYCQKKNGVCYASVETLAAHLGISEKSVRRHLKKLCGAGYLEDLTPGVRNKTHTYKDTAKVELRGAIRVVVGQRVQPNESGWTESPTGWSESPTDSLDRESNEYTKDTIQDTGGSGVLLSEDEQITFTLLQDAGINGAGRFTHYGPEHIKALLTYANSHGLGAGWIVERLKANDWKPREPQTSEEREKRKREERHRRYGSDPRVKTGLN